MTVTNKEVKYVKSRHPKNGKKYTDTKILPNNTYRYVKVKLFYTQISFESGFGIVFPHRMLQMTSQC